MFYCQIFTNIQQNLILDNVDGSHIIFQNSSTMKHIMTLIDTELICLEHTLIALRNNLHISIKTEVRTHIVRIRILLSQQIQLPVLRVYEVFIKLILLTIALIHLVTFH